MPCCRRKRNRLATAPRARQGVNLTRGVGRSVLLIYAPVARSRGLFKESWTFLSFIRRNNLATETSQRRVKRASASTSSRWLPAALFLLLFYASSGPAASSQLHAHTRTCSPTSIRRRLVAPPSSFHRSSIRTASLFHFYVPVTPARNSSTVTSRLSSLKLTTYREIFYLYPRRNVSTVYICNTWSDAGQRRVHRPRPMFPFFPSTVPGRLASCNLL